MKILLLGAAGAMAKVIVRDLLDSQGVQSIGLADIDIARVRDGVKELGDERLVPIQANAKDVPALARAMKDWDVVVNSTWYELNLGVMGAAIDAGIHYLDLGGLYHMTLKQLSMNDRARDAGVSCVLGLGSSPGITNLMALHCASMFDSIASVKIRVAGAAIRPVSGLFNPPYSFRTIIDEACMPAVILRNGTLQQVPGMSVKEEFALPDPVGKVEGYYTLHSELATLPRTLGKGVRDMDFIVAFSPSFSRTLELLVGLGLARKEKVDLPSTSVSPYELLMKLVDRLPPAPPTPTDVGIRRVEMVGRAGGKESKVVYDCVSGPHVRWGIGGRALGTGVPASLGAQWLALGKVKESGVLPPEECIAPEPFLKELGQNDRGIEVLVQAGANSRKL